MDESGLRLREYLLNEKISQNEVAEMLGVSSAYVNMICMGRKSIGKKTAARLQEAVGVSAGWLLTGDGSMYVIPPAPAPLQEENIIDTYGKVIKDVEKLNHQLKEEIAEVRRLQQELIEVISEFRKPAKYEQPVLHPSIAADEQQK